VYYLRMGPPPRLPETVVRDGRIAGLQSMVVAVLTHVLPSLSPP
jgi:hypothetical protein